MFLEMKQHIHEMVETLPEPKLALIFDFMQYLRERDTATERLWMQMQSEAYQEWVRADNDIYDRVFADVQTR